MTLKIGFIGAGNINGNHMKHAQAQGLDLVAVADLHEPAAVARGTEFSMKPYDDPAKMFEAEELDLVVIGTPNFVHKDQAVMALEAGVNVLLEKPMAMNATEADAIISARDKSGKTLMMGMPNRFKSSTQALLPFTRGGNCGDLYAGQSFWWRRRGIPGFGGWFTQKDKSGGGGLIDIGVHMLDLALYLWGFPKVKSVSGCTYNVYDKLSEYTYTSMWGKPVGETKDVDDLAFALIRFEDGGHLQLNATWASNRPDKQPEMGIFLQGTKGGVGLDGMDTPRFYGEVEGSIADVHLQHSGPDGLAAELAHFVKVLEDDAALESTAEQGRTVMSILDAIYKSSEQGSEVAVS